jgi:hypothetical protein
MEPLDLTQRPPRSPRETIGGVYFLPRTVDKLRAELPGGNLGAYLTDYDRGFSSYVLHKIGVTFDELRAVVAHARDDDAVEAWLRARIAPDAGAKINARLESLRIDGMTPDDRALFFARHPAVAGDTPELLLDALEADDAALVAAP